MIGGGQIAYGGTTFFETFWPAWAQVLGPNDAIPNCQSGYTSLCHPWSSGVTKWLTEEILGIKPTGPGFSRYDVFPHLGRTLTAVAGSVPTPQGTLRAAFDVGKGQASFVVPPNTVGRIGIPKVERTIRNITINGALAWDGAAFHAVPGVGGVNMDAEFVTFDPVQPGTYEMKVAYAGSTPAFQDAPWRFPAAFVKEDRTSGGNWGGKYGRDGRVLFGSGRDGQDQVQLPGYVQEVTHRQGRTTQWPGPGGRGALAEDATNAPERRGGVLYSGAPGDVQRCLVVDVALKHPTKFQLGFYFVDLDRKGRRQTLELFDLDSRKLIAPTHLYDDFTGGIYAIYECQQSVRVRVNHVRGDNAVLSGLFFDAGPK